MTNRTDGMQQRTIQRDADETAATGTDSARRFERRTTPSAASKAEDMVALLANRIRSNEARS